MSETYPLKMSLLRETWVYVSNVRLFTKADWWRYLLWISLLYSLVVGTGLFVAIGVAAGVTWPGYVWNVPIFAFVMATSISLDDIGHRVLYADELAKGEDHVHQMITVSAVGSIVALCMAYDHPETMGVIALSLLAISFFFTIVDEAMHWRRYLSQGIDRTEMWSHFGIIVGHVVMSLSWWQWYTEGYVGVQLTLAQLSSWLS